MGTGSMGRFSCPRCKAILELASGTQATCATCGQRLQLPVSSEDAPAKKAAAAAPLLPTEAKSLDIPETRLVLGRMHVFWHCPTCHGPVDIPLDLRQHSVRCPSCRERIPVPAVAAVQPPLPSARPPAPAPPYRDPEPSHSRRSRRPREEDSERPRRRVRRANDDYDDDDDSDYRHRRSQPGPDQQTCARAASFGLTCSLISLGLIVLSTFVILVIQNAGMRPERQGILFVVSFIAVAIAFVMSLLGTIFSSRGMNPVNEINRGTATGGLVCGIIGLVISAIGGLIVSCAGFFFWAVFNARF